MKGRETPFSRAVGRYANPTAGKLTLAKAVFVYMFGGGLGTLWEVIFNVFYQIANDYTIRYIDCRGSLFTYFNPVYGCGALVIVFFLKKYSRPWQVFTVGALAGGAVEYFFKLLRGGYPRHALLELRRLALEHQRPHDGTHHDRMGHPVHGGRLSSLPPAGQVF